MDRVNSVNFVSFWCIAAALLLGLALPCPAAAQDREVPYWASLTADKVNMRVGPARDYRIAWVFRRDKLPMKVVRLHEGWRLVEDPDGARGWVLSRFLSRRRTALVTGAIAEMREGPGSGRLLWRLEPGVVAELGDCASGWCQLRIRDRAGYVRADRLWGDGPP
jgi:SH3-like domain-containing protein